VRERTRASRVGYACTITSAFGGEMNGELASLPDSGARSGHPATMQLNEIAHYGETHAEPGLGARIGCIALLEEIE
jgi:hypothetical protein